MTHEELERFRAFVHQCVSNRKLLEEFDRLNGTNLCGRGTPIQLAVDHATRRLESDAVRFLVFCADLLDRMQPEEAKP